MQPQTPQSSTRPDQFQTSHSRWLALTQRLSASHSSFFYGVKTTQIYCRPTCSARLARRANVVFYDTEEQARRDGFRPCKRCKPDDGAFVGEAEEVATRALALLRTKKGNDVAMGRSLKQLAAEVGVTPSYLCRVFKKTLGVTIGAYMREFEQRGEEEENAASEAAADTEEGSSSVVLSPPPPSTVGSSLGDAEMGALTPTTPATTVRTLSTPAEGWQEMKVKEGLAEESFGNRVEDVLDLDFDFDEWLWSEDFSNDDNLYGPTSHLG